MPRQSGRLGVLSPLHTTSASSSHTSGLASAVATKIPNLELAQARCFKSGAVPKVRCQIQKGLDMLGNLSHCVAFPAAWRADQVLANTS